MVTRNGGNFFISILIEPDLAMSSNKLPRNVVLPYAHVRVQRMREKIHLVRCRDIGELSIMERKFSRRATSHAVLLTKRVILTVTSALIRFAYDKNVTFYVKICVFFLLFYSKVSEHRSTVLRTRVLV